ncbi:MarR family winged helix-turn-helix transcriptional regulator [Paenibacillus sp. YN15]|uniref:MarR family winged helix-turn-helix transcriptional regulator n=1 Tax=Paenibacillus sp. YN15 TaxID=1742774 RepID=UPI000DCDF069|nr:MarR family transcriptional regulator [Paenibacillus sp. YN15]RAV01461.1 MarR family transcriptional regulator [Paenibacillus sp. YN15]
MESQSFMDLDKQLCFALYACSKEITRMYRPLLAPLGLTYTQYITLLAIWKESRMKVKELGEVLYLDSGTLTPLLKKLEVMGLVKRTRDTQDERNVWIEVTEAGRKLQKQATHIPQTAFCRSGMTPEEAISLHRQLKELLVRLDSIPPLQTPPAGQE